MTIETMQSPSGGDVPNQIIIRCDGFAVFKSYDSIIAVRANGKVYLDRTYWDYSKTTGKYRNIFLREDKKETMRKIKDGTYMLADLNDEDIVKFTLTVNVIALERGE